MSKRGGGRGIRVRAPAPAPGPGSDRRVPTSEHTAPSPENNGGHSSSDEELKDKMKALSMDIDKIMQRPSLGTKGRKVALYANYFDIQLSKKQLVVQQYKIDVFFEKRKLDRDEKRAAFKQIVKQFQATIFKNPFELLYDGNQMLFTLSKLELPGGIEHSFKATVLLGDRETVLDVKLMYTGAVHVSLDRAFTNDLVPPTDKEQTPLTVIDLLFRQWRSDPDNPTFYPYGRSVYRVPGGQGPRALDLGKGMELWTGLFSSTKICQTHDQQAITQGWKPLLNVDLSFTWFYKKQPCVEFMCEVLEFTNGGGDFGGRGGGRGGRGGGRGGHPGGGSRPQPQVPNRPLTEPQRVMFEREMKNLKVEVINLKQKRVYTVRGVTKPANEEMFELTGTGMISVADYFAQHRNQPLKFPHLPCLLAGSRQHEVKLPLEVCMLREKLKKPNKKLDDQQVADMIKHTAVPAMDRLQRISEQAQEAFADTNDQYLRTYGVSLNLKMTQLHGRVLDPPGMAYANNKTVKPQNGEWRSDRERFAMGGKIEKCAMFNLYRCRGANDQVALETFFFELLKRCSQLGMRVSEELSGGPTLFMHVAEKSQLENHFNKAHELQVDLILVVLPGKNTDLYAEVKRLGDVDVGVMTQCVLWKNVQGRQGAPSPMTLGNIALKINLKRSGSNCGLRGDEACRKYLTMEMPVNGAACPVLYLGVDVTHPGRHDSTSPSISAVVGNLDGPGSGPTRYGASIKVQKEKREHIVTMSEQVKERLMQFYKVSRQKPRRIVVFRDGVSEGQFVQVLRQEMGTIRHACSLLDDNYKPGITYIVCQKRHHTRLFPVNRQDQVGRAGNVPPGTTVDTTITHPYEFDFFLCSHAGIQGTSKPAHYFVLHDDNNFTADELQSITFQLCHVYGRCCRSVSIPAPTYYADLCCTRARLHLNQLLGSGGSRSTAADGTTTSESMMNRAITIHKEITPAGGVEPHTPMYFV